MPLDERQRTALEQPFDPGRVRKREGPGGRELSYLAGHDVIRRANAIFGYGQWGYHVHELTHIGTERYTAGQGDQGRKMVRVAYRCVVVLFVDGGQDTSGVGYGDSTERYYEHETSLTAHELAIKESETDAVKRALKNYGDQFGLALYDEEKRKMLEGAASDEEVYAAIKELVERGGEEDVIRNAIASTREKYEGLLPRGWLQRQVQLARGAVETPPDEQYG